MIPFSKFFKGLLLEMPARITSFGNTDATQRAAFVNNKNADIKMRGAMLVSSFDLEGNKIDVFEKKLTDDWVRYFFLSEEQRIAYYACFEYQTTAMTQIAEAKKGFLPGRSLMAHLYTNFLLEKYDTVISDSGLTASGFNFWKNNFDFFRKKGYVVGVCKVEDFSKLIMKNIIVLENSSQLEKYYTSNEWRYFVSKL